MALPEGRGFGVGRGFLARYYTAYWKWRFSFTRYKYQAFLYTVSSIRSVTSTRVTFSLIYLRGSWLPNSYLFQATTWTIFRQVARNLTKPCCCINNNKMFEYIKTISLILPAIPSVMDLLFSYQSFGQDFQGFHCCFHFREHFLMERLWYFQFDSYHLLATYWIFSFE